MSNHASHHRRRRPHFRRRTAPGAPPGVVAVDPQSPPPVIQVFAYGEGEFLERNVEPGRLDALPPIVAAHRVTWVNVDGLGDAAVIRRLGEMFGLHQLALEDVVNVHQRAKLEPYGDHLFIVARMIHRGSPLETEQLSLFLGDRFVLTFQHLPGDCLDPVRQRLRQAGSKIHELGPDYLAYVLLDAVVDGYFPVLEHYGEMLDRIEERVMSEASIQSLHAVRDVRHDLLTLRRAIWPHREALAALARDTSSLVTAPTQLYLRDCYDHVIQIMDLLEMYRELGADLRDAYLSTVSNRMNDVMRVLTVIATVFIPLTFITSIYGMNFNPALPGNMPELEIPYAYLALWLVMAGVTLGMLNYFRRKGWLGSPFAAAGPEAANHVHRGDPAEAPLHAAHSELTQALTRRP